MVPPLVEIPLVNKESIADPANGGQCFLSFIVSIDSTGKPISGYGRTIDQKGKKKVKKAASTMPLHGVFDFIGIRVQLFRNDGKAMFEIKRNSSCIFLVDIQSQLLVFCLYFL